MKILKILSCLASASWAAAGLLIIGSIYLSSIGYIINLLMGSVFILTGFFLYIKEKHLLSLLQIPEKEYGTKQEKLHRIVVREEIFLEWSPF